jgi:PAS domain S-box-containing protein
VGVGIDITERKRVEDALHESEERYRTIVEDQTEFICRFIPDGTHTFVNEAYCRTFGLDREKVIGTRFKPKIHPEDRDIVTGLINSLTPNHQVETIDQRTIMPDNSIRWQRWVDRAIFRADGSLKEYQSVGRDITELIDRDLALNQKNIELQASYEQISAAEEELRHQVEEIMVEQQARHESEEKFRLVVESAPDAIFVQTDGLFAYCNPAAIRLFDATSTEQLEGRRVLEHVHPDFQETFREKFRHLEEEQEPIKNFEKNSYENGWVIGQCGTIGSFSDIQTEKWNFGLCPGHHRTKTNNRRTPRDRRATGRHHKLPPRRHVCYRS